MDRKTAEKAARWWKKKLTDRKPHNNGVKDPRYRMMCRIADDLAHDITQPQADEFEKQLRIRLVKMDDSHVINIGCDYGPCRTLAIAANKAGIGMMNFPFKTTMQIRDGVITVRDGYQKPWKEI